MCKWVRLAHTFKYLTHHAESAEVLNSVPNGPGSDLCTLEC
jgi:hypothetical protein